MNLDKAERSSSPEISIGVASRVDSFTWSEASSSVNIASELKWQNLQSMVIDAGIQYEISNWYLSSNLDYGEIRSGDNQDSDYNGNNRTLEYSRSTNRAGGKVMDFSLGLSYPVFSGVLLPSAGYSMHIQSLTFFDGYQVIPATGSFAGLNSTYQAIWNGPWIGFTMKLPVSDACNISAITQYHSVDFNAVADWNLRTEFTHPVSFTQSSHGDGVSAKLEIDYIYAPTLVLNFGVDYFLLQTLPGTDTTYFTNGTTGSYRLNEARWEATSVHARLKWNF